jgi:hypothetical protein
VRDRYDGTNVAYANSVTITKPDRYPISIANSDGYPIAIAYSNRNPNSDAIAQPGPDLHAREHRF